MPDPTTEFLISSAEATTTFVPSLFFDAEGIVKNWNECMTALCGDALEGAHGTAVSEVFTSLHPTDLLTDLTKKDCIAGLVTLPVKTGVPQAYRAEIARTSNGFTMQLQPTAKTVAHDMEQTTEARLNAMLQWVPGFCYTVDTSLIFTSSNGVGLAKINATDGQFVGMPLTELWGTRETHYEPLQCHLRALAGMTQNYRDVCVGRSLDYELTPLRDETGSIIGVIGVGLDVTERETSRDEKSVLLAQLRQAQKMESVGQLAGGIAHDFNNLLTCIMGNVALATELAEPGSKPARMLEGAAAAAESAATLTRQLLAFSRKQVIEPRPLNLTNLIQRVQLMLRRLIGKAIALKVEAAPDLWFVQADPGQLEQILVNLVVNARDAIDSRGQILVSTANHILVGGGPTVGHLAPGQYVRLTVADDGRGMPETVRTKIFEPFFTTKETGEGTGLGLATVYGAIQQNGGEIIVDSALGTGSQFHIYLPRVDAPQRESSEGKPVKTGSDHSYRGTERIVLVEDELSVLELSQHALESLGYTVLPCPSADEALRLFEKEGDTIHLLVTDVVMPRINGKELAGRIAALHPRVSVLYTSGYGESLITNNGIVEANVHFLPKPFRPAQLAKKVREVLDEERAGQETHA